MRKKTTKLVSDRTGFKNRFGLIKKILKPYNLIPTTVSPPQSGYRNKSYRIQTKDGQDLNLIIYKNEKGIVETIKNANYVSEYLESKGFRCRKSISLDGRSIIKLTSILENQIPKTKYQRLKSILNNSQHSTLNSQPRFACLYNYLPGQTIPWEAYTMKHIKLLGKTMSDMHFALKDLEQGEVENWKGNLLRLNKRMNEYFSDKGVIAAMRDKLSLRIQEYKDTNKKQDTKNKQTSITSPRYPIFDKFVKLFEKINKSPSQILHMDFVRSNILFINSKIENQKSKIKITGILDFEKTLYGPPIIDIARSLSFLLVDCKHKEPQKVWKYFLHSGYEKRGQNPMPNTPYLKPLIYFFLLYDFYKFLAYNVYEGLDVNEHYLKTRDILLKKNILIQT